MTRAELVKRVQEKLIDTLITDDTIARVVRETVDVIDNENDGFLPDEDEDDDEEDGDEGDDLFPDDEDDEGDDEDDDDVL